MAKRQGKLAIGGLILAALGYLAGILTAPKSGKETRKDIQAKALKAKRDAEKNLKAAHAELSHLVDEAKAKAKGLGDKAKTEVEHAVEKGQQAKEKVRVLLSAIHEGDAEDKDLKKAIDEANKAVAHLKQYVGKNAKTKAK